MAKVTQYDGVGEWRGGGVDLDLGDGSGESFVSRGRIVETPTSGESRSKDDDDDVGVESDFEVSGEGVPLKRLPRPKAKTEKEKTKARGGAGVVDVGEPHTDDELVVRWSQDGGSPTSFRKLREQHKARRGSHSTAGMRKKRNRRKDREGVKPNGGDMEEFVVAGGGVGGSGIFYTKEEERKVRRKMDKWLVGFLAGLYMLSFLDRSSELSRSWFGWFF